MFHWLSNLVRTFSSRPAGRSTSAADYTRRLRFEACEDRRMLASMADIVFHVDERHASSSIDDFRVQTWLDDVVEDLDTQLGNNLNLSFDNSAVPNGSYVVELFFAELGGTDGNLIPEQRKFDIKLESVTVLEEYEIYDDHSDNGYDVLPVYGEVAIGYLDSATMESGDNDPNFHGMHGVVIPVSLGPST